MSPFTRQPYQPNDLDAIVAFCLAHPGGNHDERLIRTLIDELPASREHVLDLWHGDKRLLLAVLLDTLTNATGTAELVVLGLQPTAADDGLFAEVLCWGETLAGQGPRQALEVTLSPVLQAMRPALLVRGYDHAYSCYDMETGPVSGLTPAPPTLPEAWRWEDLSEAYERPYYELLLAAFAGIPGAQIASWEDFPGLLRASPIAPRLLLYGDRLAGIAKVMLRGEDHAEGYIGTIARHPDYRDDRLGPYLLHEAMRLLQERGANRYSLCVAATNQRALALYQAHGFAVVGEEPGFIKHVRENVLQAGAGE